MVADQIPVTLAFYPQNKQLKEANAVDYKPLFLIARNFICSVTDRFGGIISYFIPS